MKQYIVVEGREGRVAFEDKVSALIFEGYYCQGGVAIRWDGKTGAYVYTQAMVKEPVR